MCGGVSVCVLLRQRQKYVVVEVCGREEQEALREYGASERDGQNEEAKEEMAEANVSGTDTYN